MNRKLGKFETAAALSGEHAVWNIVGVVLLAGMPAVESVRQALAFLQNRHPFLGVRLIKRGSKHYFESGEVPAIPLQIIEKETEDHWVKIAEENLNHKFDHLQGPLAKCSYLSNKSAKGEIVLTAQHSIVDGTSIENLLHELVELCSKIESEKKIENFDRLTPLAPIEDYFPFHFQGFRLHSKTIPYFIGQMADEFKYQMNLLGKRKPPIDTKAKGRIIQIHTSEEMTSNLVKRARKMRVTLNSIVNAAVLMSVRKHLYSNVERPYRYMVMADLRPYLNPIPPENEIGCFISPLRYTLMVSATDDLWSLSEKMNTQIYQSTKGGEKFLASVMGEQFLKMTFGLKRFRMCTTAISYGGSSMRTQMEYGPFKIKSIRGFVSNFGLGPEFSGRVGLYDGELVWDMLYLDSDMDREKAAVISKGIEEILHHAVED